MAEDYDLSVLAGGDIYEWAVAQVNADHEAALQRLKAEFPNFFEGEA